MRLVDEGVRALMDETFDETQEWCSGVLLPTGSAPVTRCAVQGPHEEHQAATGERWTDPDWH